MFTHLLEKEVMGNVFFFIFLSKNIDINIHCRFFCFYAIKVSEFSLNKSAKTLSGITLFLNQSAQVIMRPVDFLWD